MGLFSSLFDLASTAVTAPFKISVTAISATLGVTEAAVQQAINAGCRTTKEIEEFLGLDD